jgi:hypothetical protein
VDAAGGGNYQTLINTVLREYIRQRQEPLEHILRRVLREESGRAARSCSRVQSDNIEFGCESVALPAVHVPEHRFFFGDALFPRQTGMQIAQ